jgi:hypothetical protein
MSTSSYDRRDFIAYFSSVGLGSTLLPGVLWAQVQQQPGSEITKEMIAAAEEISGLKFSDDERTAMVRNLQQMRGILQQLHKEPLDQSILPAIVFDPVPPGKELAKKTKMLAIRSKVPLMSRPGSIEELAYAPVTQLSDLVRTRKVKPSELTDMYLSRLKRFDPQLHFVVNLTEERARAQAKDLDAEISRGKYRGPLHGIPWGAKDLLAVKGYPTTWGAGLYKDQTFDYEATVVKRLDWRDPGREAHAWVARAGQPLVGRVHAQSVDSRTAQPGFEWLVGGPRLRHGRGMRRLQHRLRDEWLDHLPVPNVWRGRLSAKLWTDSTHRRDGTLVDDRQAWSHLSERRRLRARF